MPARTANARRVALDLVRALNAHDLEAAARLFAPDYNGRNVARAGPSLGGDAARRTLAATLVAFPDLALEIEDTLADGERVVLVWRARGTHRGPWMNIPPTGRPVDVRGISVLTARGDCVVRGMHVWDLAGLLRELKLLPELP